MVFKLVVCVCGHVGRGRLRDHDGIRHIYALQEREAAAAAARGLPNGGRILLVKRAFVRYPTGLTGICLLK